MKNVQDTNSLRKPICLECGATLTEVASVYCPKCRPMATKRDNEILDRMPYDRAEELVIEVLKLAIKDLRKNMRALEKAKSRQDRVARLIVINECKRYIKDGLHREIVESNPDMIINMIENEVNKKCRKKK